MRGFSITYESTMKDTGELGAPVRQFTERHNYTKANQTFGDDEAQVNRAVQLIYDLDPVARVVRLTYFDGQKVVIFNVPEGMWR